MPRLTLPAIFFLLLTVAFPAWSPGQAQARDVLERFNFDLSAGYRVDQIDWNIAGNIGGTSPNILSELTWDDLESYQVTARGQVLLGNQRSPFGGTIRGSLSYGDIYAGGNQDSDYFGDNRTREFSRSNNNADKGDVWDGSLGGGVVFFMAGRKFALTPLLGVSYHKQNLSIYEGYQTVSDPSQAPPLHPGITLPPVGPIAGLDSTYEARWWSGWFGLDLNYQPIPAFSVHGSVETHGGSYEATGNWNLRDDLQHPDSFKHTSDNAFGVVTNLGLRAGGPRLQLTLDFYYQKWQVDDGEDRTYFSDGTVGITKLNEVNWEATSLNAGLTYSF